MGVRCLVPIDPPRIHETVGRLMGLHVADAAAGQVGTQAELFVRASLIMALQPVGIHAFPGRMVRREIQLVKGVHLACDLVLLEDLESHGTEGIVQVVAHLRDRMQPALPWKDSGNRTVKIRRHFRGFQLQIRPLCVNPFRDLPLCLVEPCSHFGAKLRNQIRKLLHQKT